MIKPLQLFFSLAFVALTTACGGGGGGFDGGLSPADATVDIDANNAIDVVRSVNDSSEIAESLVLDPLVGAAGASTAFVAAMAAGPEAETLIAPFAQNPDFCNGGNPGTAEVIEDGLIARFSFMNCQDFMYTSTSEEFGELSIEGLVNGELRVEILLTVPKPTPTDFQADVTLENFSIDDGSSTTSGNGSLRLDYLDTGSSVIVDITTQSPFFDITKTISLEDPKMRSLKAYSFFLVDDGLQTTESSSGGVTSSDFEGFDMLAYFETPQPFVTVAGDTWPSEGKFIIYGVNQARIRVTALNDGLTALIELDVDEVDDVGDDSDYELSCEYAWDVLLGDTSIIACN